jgi:hypothetical protein
MNSNKKKAPITAPKDKIFPTKIACRNLTSILDVLSLVMGISHPDRFEKVIHHVESKRYTSEFSQLDVRAI